MQRRLTRFIVLIALILAGFYVMQRVQLLPSFSSLFKSKGVEIENTVILVKEINNLAQLITITAYNEIAIDSVKKGWSLFNNPMVPSLLNIPNLKQPDHTLIIIGKGRVLAGVNLAKLSPGAIFVQKDSVSIVLPKAEILQVVLNPSGFEIFEEKGKWTDEEVTAVKIKLREKLIAKAMEQDILNKAAALAVTKLEQFLRTAGFTRITVRVQ